MSIKLDVNAKGGPKPAALSNGAAGSQLRTPLAGTHEELYGCLFGVDKSLANGSALVVGLFLLSGAAAVLGLCLGWFDGPAGRNLDFLRNAWICGLLLFAMLYLGLLINTLRRRRVYRRRRGELLDAVRTSGLSYHAVVSRIKGDPELARVASRLSADAAFQEDLSRGPGLMR